MNIQWRRVNALARKEWLHVLHDPRSLVIIFLMPVLQLIIFGYAMNMDVQNVPLTIIDYDHSQMSSDIGKAFAGSTIFKVSEKQESPDIIHKLFLRSEAKAVLIIAEGSESRWQRNLPVSLQFAIDAADPNAAALIQKYGSQIIQTFNQEKGQIEPVIDLRVQTLYNPSAKSAPFFVPGLIAMILIMISALLTSITLTREKETGTMEQLLVSPIRPFEILLGKLAPYVLLSFCVGTFILLFGILLFKVPFVGSVALMMGLSLVYIFTALSLGLMISTITDSQQVAMMMAIMITLLPTMMLSGFIFAIESMPKWLQYFTYLVPARYYTRIIRGIMLKDNSLLQLWEPTAYLIGFSIVFLVVALKKFKQQLN